MSNKTIAVFGATGAQGGSVVRYLKENTNYTVRALTRNPAKYTGLADEAVAANLDDEKSLNDALKGVYGAFVVTNFWQQGTDESAQAQTAVAAALNQGVKHFVWSSLPDVDAISAGKWEVPHFTNKARIDTIVRAAGFPVHTIVQPSFYFENLIGNMAPSALEGGIKGWAVPIDPKARVIHMGAIEEFGSLVAGVFADPEQTNGKTLSMAAGLYSFADVADAFNAAQKEQYTVVQVPYETYSNFFPGASELAQMLGYFQDHCYMGPESEDRIEAANKVAVAPFTPLLKWLNQ